MPVPVRLIQPVTRRPREHCSKKKEDISMEANDL